MPLQRYYNIKLVSLSMKTLRAVSSLSAEFFSMIKEKIYRYPPSDSQTNEIFTVANSSAERRNDRT